MPDYSLSSSHYQCEEILIKRPTPECFNLCTGNSDKSALLKMSYGAIKIWRAIALGKNLPYPELPEKKNSYWVILTYSGLATAIYHKYKKQSP
jgi:hypothetical protein